MTTPLDTPTARPGYFAQAMGLPSKALDRLFTTKDTVTGAIAARTPERISNVVKKIQDSSIAMRLEPWGVTKGSAVGFLSAYAGIAIYNGAPTQAAAALLAACSMTSREHFYPVVFAAAQISFTTLAYVNLNGGWNPGVTASPIRTSDL